MLRLRRGVGAVRQCSSAARRATELARAAEQVRHQSFPPSRNATPEFDPMIEEGSRRLGLSAEPAVLGVAQEANDEVERYSLELADVEQQIAWLNSRQVSSGSSRQDSS